MKDRNISESGEYWKKHILSWEASAYYKDSPRQPNLWDRLSTVFRGNAMYRRMNAALESLKPHIGGRTILDIGCASGRFPLQLMQAGAAKVYGLDISPEAIQMAEETSRRLGLEEQMEFCVADAIHPETPLPQTDLVTALGVIEYFDAPTLSTFLGNLRSRYFFLDFPDSARRREFPTWLLRQVYIRVNRLPGVYLYRPEEFIRLAEPLGYRDIHVIKRDIFYFITNLPK